MSFTLAQFLVTLTCLALPTVLGIKAPPPVVKNGFYRITNLNDGSVRNNSQTQTIDYFLEKKYNLKPDGIL